MRWLDRQSSWIFTAGLLALLTSHLRQLRTDCQRSAEWSRRRTLSREPLTRTPRVSMLVAAWNEGAALQRHVDSLLGLRYPSLEVILVAGGDDETYATAARCASRGVVVLPQVPGEGKQRALRKGYASATGEIVYLTDADCVLDDDAFERVLAPLVNHGAAAATGGSRPTLEQARRSPFVAYQWAVDDYVAARTSTVSSGLLGRNCAIRRDVLDAVGAFEPDVLSGTDYDLALRLRAAGYRIVAVPESRVQTRYAESFGHYFRQRRRWLRNLLVHGWARRDFENLVPAVSACLLGIGLLLGPLAALLRLRLGIVVWWLAYVSAAMSRARYLAFVDVHTSTRGVRAVGRALGVMGDALVWAAALFDLANSRKRARW